SDDWRAVPIDQMARKLKLMSQFSERNISWGYNEFYRFKMNNLKISSLLTCKLPLDEKKKAAHKAAYDAYYDYYQQITQKNKKRKEEISHK
ncbi:MAG: hypothetical protein WCS73_09220, partial [Lentisphaeria bacterium]